jgi:hypothetical protein
MTARLNPEVGRLQKVLGTTAITSLPLLIELCPEAETAEITDFRTFLPD